MDFVDANDKPIAEAGEEIQFIIRVKNTGNIDIEGLDYFDTFEDGNGTSLRDNLVLNYSSANISNEGSILVDEIITYTANYTITTSDVNSGYLSNQIEFASSDPELDWVKRMTPITKHQIKIQRLSH